MDSKIFSVSTAQSATPQRHVAGQGFFYSDALNQTGSEIRKMAVSKKLNGFSVLLAEMGIGNLWYPCVLCIHYTYI